MYSSLCDFYIVFTVFFLVRLLLLLINQSLLGLNTSILYLCLKLKKSDFLSFIIIASESSSMTI